MKPCRAYYGPAHLVCGLMEHEGDHLAAARFAGQMRRIPFPDSLVSFRLSQGWGYPR